MIMEAAKTINYNKAIAYDGITGKIFDLRNIKDERLKERFILFWKQFLSK